MKEELKKLANWVWPFAMFCAGRDDLEVARMRALGWELSWWIGETVEYSAGGWVVLRGNWGREGYGPG